MSDMTKLEQVRRVWGHTRHNPCLGMVQWFCADAGELSPDDGPEARLYLRTRRFLMSVLNDQARDLAKAIRRAYRRGFRAPVYAVVVGVPWIRADYVRGRIVNQLEWACPHCGRPHRIPYELGSSRRDLVHCTEDPSAACVAEITRQIMPLLIPAYIPGRNL